MRRLAVALSFSLVVLALIPAAASARGPQKNDSVNGHGFVVADFGTTYEFRVSAHTLSTTTTAATGNMYVQQTISDASGTTTVSVWADVYCLSVLAINGEVRGHIYRTEPDLLTVPEDLVFNVSDLNPVTSGPDLFSVTDVPAPSACIEPPEPGLLPVAKGDVTVNDEGP